MKYAGARELSLHLLDNIALVRIKVSTTAYVAEPPSSALKLNMIQAPDGRVFGLQSMIPV